MDQDLLYLRVNLGIPLVPVILADHLVLVILFVQLTQADLDFLEVPADLYHQQVPVDQRAQ